jgi:hypothetical protein
MKKPEFLRDAGERKWGYVIYEYRCFCGKIFSTYRASVNSGNTLSCGCLRGGKVKDITNQRFGRLIAVRRTPKQRNGKFVWECKCDCKSITHVPINDLTTGNTKSCGKCSRINDLQGLKFGRLIVLERTIDVTKNYVVWKCKCDCGNITCIAACSLSRGLTKSCGCLHREYTATIKGENHPSWNPNLTDEHRVDRRNIPGYTDLMKKCYKRDGYTCQCCGKRGKGLKLNAHHIRDYATYPELRFELSNLITLCTTCHYGFHSKYGKGKNNPWQLTRFKNYIQGLKKIER